MGTPSSRTPRAPLALDPCRPCVVSPPFQRRISLPQFRTYSDLSHPSIFSLDEPLHLEHRARARTVRSVSDIVSRLHITSRFVQGGAFSFGQVAHHASCKEARFRFSLAFSFTLTFSHPLFSELCSSLPRHSLTFTFTRFLIVCFQNGVPRSHGSNHGDLGEFPALLHSTSSSPAGLDPLVLQQAARPCRPLAVRPTSYLLASFDTLLLQQEATRSVALGDNRWRSQTVKQDTVDGPSSANSMCA